jgi:hypothetical protein
VLPSAKDRAKDMSIVNIANTLLHSVAPVLAGFILALTHSYSVLYIAETIFVLLGIFTVTPIKVVRSRNRPPGSQHFAGNRVQE